MKYLDIPDIQWAPDADYTKLGVLNTVTALVPTTRGGYTTASAMTTTGQANMSTTPCVGAACLKWADGTVHVYAASTKRIYEADGVGGGTDRSAGGVDYNVMADCQFAAYGSATLACSLSNNLQVSTGAAFSQAVASSKARCIAVMSNVVMLLNYDDGTATPDGYMASAVGDYTNFTAATSNDAIKGRLLDTPGPITAGATLNDTVIAWKSRGMYVGRFVGGTKKWDWQVISADIGCVSPNGWVHTDRGIVFVSERDIFLYDGGTIRSIADGRVRKNFYTGRQQTNNYIKLQYDAANSLVYVFANVTANGTGCDFAWVWNHESDKWGYIGDGSGRFGSNSYSYVTAVIRNSNASDFTAKGFTNCSTVCAPVITSEGATVNFVGSYGTSSPALTTGVWGQMGQVITVQRVYPLYLGSPSGDTLTINAGSDIVSVGVGPNGYATSQATITAKNRFDIASNGAYFQLLHNPRAEFMGYRIAYEPGGSE